MQCDIAHTYNLQMAMEKTVQILGDKFIEGH